MKLVSVFCYCPLRRPKCARREVGDHAVLTPRFFWIPSTGAVPRPARHFFAKFFFQFVVVSSCVFHSIVQNRGRQGSWVVDAENLPQDQTDAKDVAGIGSLPVLSHLPLMGAGGERDGFEQGPIALFDRIHCVDQGSSSRSTETMSFCERAFKIR